jgi:protein O-mannosyl-transferase
MKSFPKGREKILFPIVLSLLITAAYVPTFSGQFILDDKPLVKNNLSIKKFNNPTFYLFQEDGVSEKSPPGYHTGYYRPLINLFYTMDYKMWGMNASGFRTTNLILHILTCVIFYQILFILFDERFIAFSATLLFGLHPVNTESVAWISSRNNILVTLFSLISFYYCIKHRKDRRVVHRVFSYVSFAMALLCKEFAVMLLPIFFLYQRLMVNGKKLSKNEILGYIPFIIILLLYFMLRAHAIGSALTPISISNLWKNLYFVPFLIMYNLKLILIPYGLHSYIIQYPGDYLAWKPFIGFFCLWLLCLFIWRERNHTIVIFAFFSFFLALLPVLNIFSPGKTVTLISMRWLYFPMAFLFLALPVYIKKLSKTSYFAVISILAIVLAYFGTYSYVLNRDIWHDEESFFMQEIINFKNNYYAYGYAVNLLNKKEYQKAEILFRIAIKHHPDQAKNYINYAALLIDTGRPDAAILQLNEAESLAMTQSQRGEWFNNMGMAYFKLRKKGAAITNFKKAVIFNVNEPQFWANLGGAYGSAGDYKNAVLTLQKGLQVDSEYIPLRKNLAITYIRTKEYEKAILVLEKIPAPEIEKDLEINQLLKQARKNLMKKTR